MAEYGAGAGMSEKEQPLALRLFPCVNQGLRFLHPAYYDESKSQVGTGQAQESLS